MILDLDALHASDLSLYAAVSITLGPAKGQLQVALADFPLPTRRRLSDWWVSQRELAASTPPATTVVNRPVPSPRDYAAEDCAALKKDIDESRAVSRLKKWGEAGLEDTEANAQLIRDWVNNSPVKGYFSAEIIDAAIANLGPKGTNQLTWKPKEAPPAPEPVAPVEVLSRLEDGITQLPLDADEVMMRRASVKQLQDLIRRRREASNQKYIRRGFGSAF